MKANAGIGIKDAKAPPMKAAISPFDSGSKEFQNGKAPMDERPLRICVVFDELASARDAEALIAQVASGFMCEKQAICFDELNAPKRGVVLARNVADTDLLVLAARGDRTLPSYIRLWLGLCLGLRKEGDEGALVALITHVAGCEGLHSSILEYLETIAIIGGVAFFPGRPGHSMTLKAGEKRLPRPGRNA